MRAMVLWFIFCILTILCFLAPAEGATLRQKQSFFSVMAARLIIQAEAMGYETTLGEAWRSQQQAKFILPTMFDAEKGKGVANSLHLIRLAIDLNLFQGGKYLPKTEAYRPLGEWWEKQSTKEFKFCWGGRFKRTDGNHFSIEHDGVK